MFEGNLQIKSGMQVVAGCGVMMFVAITAGTEFSTTQEMKELD
jgi:ethanolamine utilization protein EutQ (cupin superfamily)